MHSYYRYKKYYLKNNFINNNNIVSNYNKYSRHEWHVICQVMFINNRINYFMQ